MHEEESDVSLVSCTWSIGASLVIVVVELRFPDYFSSLLNAGGRNHPFLIIVVVRRTNAKPNAGLTQLVVLSRDLWKMMVPGASSLSRDGVEALCVYVCESRKKGRGITLD